MLRSGTVETLERRTPIIMLEAEISNALEQDSGVNFHALKQKSTSI